VTANIEPRRNLFQVEKIARLFIEILFDYRGQKKYLLHEFVVMPAFSPDPDTHWNHSGEGHAADRWLLFSAE
jgi:hypothetical protein